MGRSHVEASREGTGDRAKASIFSGLVLTLVLAVIAAYLGAWFPVIGGPVFGIVIGMLVKATGFVRPGYGPGIIFSAKQLLQYAIILLGAGLSLSDIMTTGSNSLVVMLGTLVVCLTAAWLLGKVMNISRNLTILVGVGTAICGASAIAAASPVIEAEEQEVAYAVSTIFLFNVMAVLLFPPIGRLLGLSQEAFGLWAGTAVNDTSSVVAAAYAYGSDAGIYATIVKLTRSTLIIPVTLGLAALQVRRSRKAQVRSERVDVKRLFPWFILWFLVAALLNTAGLLPAPVVAGATSLAKFLIVVALTAVGLSANFARMAKTGLKPLFLGLLLWAIIAVTSLVLQSWQGLL